MRKLLATIFGILVIAAPASAQDKPVTINFGFGVQMPLSGFNDAFDTGWNGGIGATFHMKPTFGFQTEYMYNWMPGPEKTITVFPTPGGGVGSNQLIESNHNMHTVTFNGVWTAPRAAKVGGYGVAGIGIYHRTVQITSPAVGYTTFCDPYWYVCYPALVEVDRILGDRSSTDFGINFGAGVMFGGEAAKFYIEFRYHYVWGPEVNPVTTVNPLANGQCSGGCSTNAQYIPITFGVRF